MSSCALLLRVTSTSVITHGPALVGGIITSSEGFSSRRNYLSFPPDAVGINVVSIEVVDDLLNGILLSVDALVWHLGSRLARRLLESRHHKIALFLCLTISVPAKVAMCNHMRRCLTRVVATANLDEQARAYGSSFSLECSTPAGWRSCGQFAHSSTCAPDIQQVVLVFLGLADVLYGGRVTSLAACRTG